MAEVLNWCAGALLVAATAVVASFMIAGAAAVIFKFAHWVAMGTSDRG